MKRSEGPVKNGVLYLWINNIRNYILFFLPIVLLFLLHFVLICTVVVLYGFVLCARARVYEWVL